ncbi:MAG TPA: hypothetical protein VGY53_00350 [Isosphaeraceae bacterium]|nr:hypothetical protein [Isosphaeraceae bacterium]
MSKVDNTYRLVMFEAPDDPKAVRDVIAGVTGTHPTDAMQWLARMPGIWPYPLAEGEVRELLDGLFDLGVPAEAWRVDSLPDLSPPRTFHNAACLPGGLQIKGLRGEPTHWVPWNKVELVSAGRLALGDEVREVAPLGWAAALAGGFNALIGRAPPSARRGRVMRIPRDPVGVALIVRKDPRIAFRVVEDQMNYSSLGERRKSSASENFPLFLNELCARATDAYITPATRSYLENKEPSEHDFPSSHALLDYTTHRLLWSWYRRDRDSERSTQM